ncbi:MAG: DUF1013 domain-containing protein, partial [Ascidiaceihabitans sp.]|nr:DUF1013 domain-containing protein [Ascidiaceihabitans sp.]
DDERRKLVSTEQSLGGEAKIPTAIEGLETFTLGDAPVEEDEDEDANKNFGDADSFFDLPAGDGTGQP